MSYSDLNTVKRINGVPVDLNYFQKVIDNDAFFKTVTDNDEDLAAVDRDIFPLSDNSYSIGSLANRFSSGNFHNLISNTVALPGGSAASNSLTIGSTGFASLNSGVLSVFSNGVESLKVKSSGSEFRSANDLQLSLENTLDEISWRIGCGISGLSFKDNNLQEKMLLSESDLEVFNILKVPSGTDIAPSYTFSSDTTTGMYKDSASPILNFTLNGTRKLSLSSSFMELFSDQLVLPNGSLTEPTLTFKNKLDTGFSGDSGHIRAIFNGKPVIDFSEGDFTITSEGSFNSNVYCYSDGDFVKEAARRAMGTKAAPTTLPAGTDIFYKGYESYTDQGFKEGASFAVSTTEDHGAGTYSTGIFLSAIGKGQTETTEKLVVGGSNNAAVHSLESFGISTKKDVVGVGQIVNVSAVSKIMVDTTSGNVSIEGFEEGREGQLLHIYNKVATNTFTLKFNSQTAAQPVLLKGSTDFVIANDFGGITLSFDDGIWREVSRS